MAVPRWAHIAAWFLTAVMVVLLLGSYTMDGTLMASLHWGWLLAGGALVMGLSVFLAIRFGRIPAGSGNGAEKVHHG